MSFSACIQPEEFDDVPFIRAVTLSTSGVAQASDGFQLMIEFEDGDGDIGNLEEDGPANIFVTDQRAPGFVPAFTLSAVPERGISKGISGILTLTMPPECCVHPDGINNCCTGLCFFDLDTVVYEIQIQDRAENLSNVVESPPLIISGCQ